MKKRIIFLSLAASLVVALTCFTGCGKEYSIQISTNNLWFGVDSGTQTLEIISNCKWTIIQNDDADWYTIDKMSGKNDATLTIAVDAMEDMHEYKSDSWERADMRKIGTVHPDQKAILLQKVTKRKKGEPIFISE